MEIEKEIKKFVIRTLEKIEGFSILKGAADVVLDTPKSKKFGDFSTNVALVLAKKQEKPPLVVAHKIQELLSKELRESNLAKQIDKIEVKGPGFINIFLSKARLYETLLKIVKNGDNFGRVNFGQGKRVHIEFVSANPTGPLNVAHGRQGAFGDTLANLMNFSRFKVTREYYLNDQGVQIDILGESVRAKYLALLGMPGQFPAAGYQGRYIDDLAQELVERYGRRYAKSSEKKLSFFSNFAYRKILKKIKTDLKAFGVSYDHWFSQKTLSKTGRIDRVLKLLKKKGYLYQQEGAWWLATTKFGDDKDRVVIKSDSRPTYITPDIAYHQTKLKRGFSKLINIWGPDHHGYIPRIKAAISALGYEADCVSFLIVQLVSLSQADKIIPMSTRLGQYISLADIIQAVGKDAARFFFLMRKRDSHLRFDLELAKKQSLENPVYYIQYAHARISNILKFAKNNTENANTNFAKKLDPGANLSLLDKTEELNLIQTLSKFSSVIESCTINLEPHRLTIYLQELAKDFHHYYEKYKVVVEDTAVRQARLILINAVRIVLKNGLRLLAISAPEQM